MKLMKQPMRGICIKDVDDLETLPTFQAEYRNRQSYYGTFLHGEIPPFSREIMTVLKERAYKAIIVYPEAVAWEPRQRPQHLLKEFAERGYLCFFCDASFGTTFTIEEQSPNLFVVNGEAYLLPVLRSQSVIVLCSWLLQMAWADLLPHKVLWYDQLDRLEFFSLYDEHMLKKHEQVTRQADIVTYTANSLLKYVGKRADAVLVPNAVRAEDFAHAGGPPPADLEALLRDGAPVIGYFGAVESWFDFELIGQVAKKRPNWRFVIIGNVSGLDLPALPSNVIFLGAKSYGEIAGYGQYFQVGIIPFKITETTNGVSPVKFFEYAALGIPVVSTPIQEMNAYQNDWVRIAAHANDFESAITDCLSPSIALKAKQEGILFARKNQWSGRVVVMEKLLASKQSAWKAYGNYNPSGKIAAMTTTFLDYNGDHFFSGGAERYVLDLHQLCRQIGKELVIYQYGNTPWIRRIRGVDVISLARGGQNVHVFSIATVKTFNRLFQEQAAERVLFSIYSAYFNAWPFADPVTSIGIIHGVSWDHPQTRFEQGDVFWEVNRRFIEGAKLCGKMVSVDTNSANWFQTIDYALGQQIQVIPNYVDTELFKPEVAGKDNSDRIVILYPRRLYAARGLYMVLEIMDDILEAYPDVEFYFAGRGDPEDTKHVTAQMAKWPGRVSWSEIDLEDMPEVYRKADIALIPTLYSEGTSLSCLEAMASGNAVIATRIGGLSDLVIHDWNGLLIEPQAPALRTAILQLLADPAKLSEMKKKASQVAAVFSKKRWEKHWSELLREQMSGLDTNSDGAEPSTQGRLVEIWLNEVPSEMQALGTLVTGLLKQGDLIYIRLKEGKAFKYNSFMRVQWLGWEQENLSEPDVILAEPSVPQEVIGKPITAFWMEEG
ncbi:glycosyltransferase [Paenibacillus sp. GCM10027628]|uniref:glycosyltransferase n=1 Tax=Paenibacillus sp. GCM10027628 TaxID=3273413 RepID=UPI003635ABED